MFGLNMTDSQELLKDTVFRLLSHGQKLDDTFKEISSFKEGRGIGDEFLSCATELNILPILRVNAERSKSSTTSDRSIICAQKIVAMVTKGDTQLLKENQRCEIELILHTVDQLLLRGQFDARTFQEIIFKVQSLPSELVIILHQHGIVRLDTFLTRFQTDESLVHLKSRLITLAREIDSTECMAVLLSELVCVAFSESTRDTDGKRIALTLMEHLVSDLFNSVLNDQTAQNSVSSAVNHLTCDLDLFKMAATHLLSMMISYKPNMKVSQAIRHQPKWAFGKILPQLVMLLKQLLVPFTPQEVVSLMGRVLDQQEVNWQLLLSLVSVLVVCMPESSSILLEFTDQLLQEGVEGCDMEPTITGLLLARQACFQGPHVFLSYSDWFQRTFSEGSRSLASSRKSFTFFIKFLTDLMPYESSQHIKVHILRPPFVPTKCRQILADYIMLAKTRLSDLNEPLEVTGSEASTADTTKTDADVVNAVSSFEATGKVPTAVMEASIFKKPYYIGHFLPALLKPRPLPDYPDSKMKLIAALKKADKLPQSLYSAYVKACKKEAQQLLDGVFLDSDSGDMELSPLDQLATSLDHMTSVIVARCSNSTVMVKYTEAECISQICEKIETLLSVSPAESSCPTPLRIDILHLNVQENYLQVIDLLLNNICQNLQTVYSSLDREFGWLSKLLKAVLRYSCLREPWCKRLWDLCVNKGPELSNHHIDTLAAIFVELQLLSNHFGDVQLLGDNTDTMETTSIIECIADRLPMNNSARMKYTLRFCAMYLRHVYSGHTDEVEEAVVLSVVKKFNFLAARLYPEVRSAAGIYIPCDQSTDQSCDIVKAIFGSEIYRKLSNSYQISLDDWVQFELVINTEDDVFSYYGDRQNYYDWALYKHFLPQLKQNGEPGKEYKLGAGIIFKAVLETCQSQCRYWYLSQCGKCDSKLRLVADSRNVHQMISIVQQLTGLFNSTNVGSTDELPWLLYLLDDILQQNDRDGQQRTACVVQFFRLCRSLPSYLVFSDVPNHLTADDTPRMDAVVRCINTVMFPCLCEGVYLPVHFTTFLVHGLYVAVEKGSFQQLFHMMCDRCPVMVPSILVHEQAMAPFLDEAGSKLGTLLQCYRSKTFPADVDPWCTSCMLFAHTLMSFSSDATMVTSFLRKQKLTGEVLGPLVQMLILQLTYCQLVGDTAVINKLDQALVAMVTSQHGKSVMEHLLSSDTAVMVASCISPDILKIKEYGTLRFLAKSREVTLPALEDAFGFTRLLEMFVSVTKRFDDSSADSNTSMDKMVTIEELSTVSSYLQRLIISAPNSVLRLLSKELLLSCGPGITDAVLKKL